MKRIPNIRSESGSVLVMSALAIVLVVVVLGAGVIQTGSWFTNRRHIQMRADAGAFAGAQLFNECFAVGAGATGLNPLVDMEEWAKRYAGFTSSVGTPQNTQFGVGSSDYVFQSQNYPGGGGPGADDTYTADTNPCDQQNINAAGGGFDIKLRQQNVRQLFNLWRPATVYGHARVQLKEVQSVVPTFPLAVPEIVPGAVAVTFVNEDTGTELTGCSGGALVAGTSCTFKLTNGNAPGTDPFNLGPWTATGQNVVLPSFGGSTTNPAIHIGMRVGVGSPTAVASCAGAGNGTTWQCFNTSTANGVVMIDEVNPNVAGSPKLQGVWPTTCSGSPFVGSNTAPVPCGATVTAKINFGSITNPTVKAVLTQSGGASQTIALALNAGLWTAPLNSASVTVNPATGGSEYTIDLCWKASGGGGGGKGPGNCPNGYSGWAGIQRVVGATNTDDGPLDSVSLADASAPNGPYSYSGPGSHSLTMSVLLKAPFNQLTILRQSHSGSATAFIECTWQTPPNPATGQLGVVANGQNALTQSLTQGCQVPYQINATNSCNPDPLTNPAMSDNPDCTQNKPCAACGNTITSALDQRFGCSGGTAQHPNLWPNYSTTGDPRAVTLITTTYGAFAQNGNNSYPVTGFGAFYIAGVSGNACGDAWPSQLGPAPNKNSGTIWGYFIKYSNNDGTPSSQACQLNAFNDCVAVLTR